MTAGAGVARSNRQWGRLIIFLQLLVVCSGASSRIRRAQVEEPDDAPFPEIVGGTVANTTIYPWFTLFVNGECAGTLISPTRVLTSASCVQSGFPFEVRVGATTRTDGKSVGVRCAKSHPLYQWPKFQYDIAVLKLEEPVTGIEFPILNRATDYPSLEGQPLLVAGLGRTSTTGEVAEELLELEYDLVTEADCKAFYGDDITLGLHVCADGVREGTCFGDAGGPLLDDILPRFLVGVVSGAVGGCADAYAPDVYSSVAAFADWIDSEEISETCNDECVGCLCDFYEFAGRIGYQVAHTFGNFLD